VTDLPEPASPLAAPLVADLRRKAQAAFIERLRRFVLDEAAAQRRTIEEEWNRPLAERVADGRAIEGVRFVGLLPDGLVEFACERNISRFREGDILCLNRGSPFFQPNVMANLELDDETRLLVYIEGHGFDLEALRQEPAGWILDEGYLDLSSFVLGALAEAGDTLVGVNRILPLLMGEAEPKTSMELFERGCALAEAVGLNSDQVEALAQAYATDLTWLIQGPPGTGKTRVLAHLARALVEDGERVLITSFTHRAINNALNTLVRAAPDTPVAKIGLPNRAGDLQSVENYEAFDLCPMAEMSGGYVIGATPFATRTRRLAEVEFDTVIFDEASQITLPLAVMGMLAGKRYIFFGDQKQLPPVLTRRYSGGAFRDSVFGALAEPRFITMLTETYRLNMSLAEWPSQQFYGGRLKPTAQAAQRRVEYITPVPRFADVLDPEKPKVFLDLGHRNITTRSHKEAGVVVDLILTLLECGVPPWEIGVVAPYRAQGREIRNQLRQALPDAEMRQQIVIDTVERMQGQEREVILVSLTTSNPTYAANLAEFFFQPERLNVAITRPRTKLIIVDSRHVLRAEPEDPDLKAAVALLGDLLSTCDTCFLDHPDA
jgi:DNA replication ATP-dependent helicase Dna2